jgi:hypothetical protein
VERLLIPPYRPHNDRNPRPLGSGNCWDRTCKRSRCAPEVREARGLSRCVESVVARSRRPRGLTPLVPGARPALRRSQAQHDPTHHPQRRPDRRDHRRVELSGRQARTATGGPQPTCHLVPRSLTAPLLSAIRAHGGVRRLRDLLQSREASRRGGPANATSRWAMRGTVSGGCRRCGPRGCGQLSGQRAKSHRTRVPLAPRPGVRTVLVVG